MHNSVLLNHDKVTTPYMTVAQYTPKASAATAISKIKDIRYKKKLEKKSVLAFNSYVQYNPH